MTDCLATGTIARDYYDEEQMSRIVSIDPGKRDAGLAVFECGRLTHCQLVSKDWGEHGYQIRAMAQELRAAIEPWLPVDKVVVEWMKQRRTLPAAVPRLMVLCGIAGGVWALCPDAEPLRAMPGDWTSRRSKAVNHKAIRRALDEEEEALLDAALTQVNKGNHKEVLDAVGIGLWAEERLV